MHVFTFYIPFLIIAIYFVSFKCLFYLFIPVEWNVLYKKKRFPANDSKLYLVVRLEFWYSGKCSVLLHCLYFYIDTDLKWYNLFGYHQYVK